MTRFKVIPLRQQNIKNEIISKSYTSYTSNSIIPGSVNHIMRPWYTHTMYSLCTRVTFGKKFVDTYDVSTKDFNRFIMTPDKVYKNDELIAEEPSVLIISPGLLHRFVIGNKGVSTMNVHVSPVYEYDESNTPYYQENILRTCRLNKEGNTIELLNDNDVQQKLVMKRWDDMQFII